MSADDVARQLWSAPATPRHAVDLANLGPAPRALDANMERYVKRTVTTLAPMWLMLAIFFSAGYAVSFSFGARQIPVLPMIFVGLTVWSFRARSERRDRVIETLRRGDLQRALVANIRTVEHRGRFGRVTYVDYYVSFDVNGRVIEHHTRDPGISLLQVGVSEEVLWCSAQPDVVVPTYMLV